MPEISSSELIQLGAVDSSLFCSTFFSKTTRQASPPFHKDIWEILDSDARLCNIQVFRGGAKTSILRMYTAKRIGYGLSRTILYIGKSEGHAVRSVRWVRRQIEFNQLYSQVFKLSPGKKWQDTECEIRHELFDHTIWLIGVGITGSIRGINFDDYRPDLIIIDDVVDEENAATPEQRHKINSLIYGAVKESLAPASETPLAKLVALQTPLNREDYSTLALDDPEWTSARFGCWTAATEDLPLAQQESIWPARYPSKELREGKAAAVARNQLSIWLREKECRIISEETSAFRVGWLRFYDVLPETMTCILAIDPVPPPSPRQVEAGLKGKDFEAFAVVGFSKGDYFLLEYSLRRGHEPSWTISEFFRLAGKWRPRSVVVEGVAYQRTLAWLLQQEMERQRRFFVVDAETDSRKKSVRIIDSLSGLASNGHLYIRREHTEFISQFSEYPSTSHDDLLDAVSMAIIRLSGHVVEDYDELMQEEAEFEKLVYARGAP